VLARTGITNGTNATITADGEGDRAGGGGGGVVVLASPAPVANQGAIRARGGRGENSALCQGPSAGGGGGIVHLLSPQPTAGDTDVGGGPAGQVTGPVDQNFRSGGGGGGASGGDGGSANTVPAGNGPPNASSPGGAGHVLLTVADPTSLF
jgi:hypothetical protein